MTTPAITVWTNPQCVQCDATKRRFNNDGIAYETRSIPDTPGKADEFKAAGHMQAPVVETPWVTWHGYRPDMHKWIAANA